MNIWKAGLFELISNNIPQGAIIKPLGGGGGCGWDFWIEQIIYFTSYLQNLFFSHSARSKIFISLS